MLALIIILTPVILHGIWNVLGWGIWYARHGYPFNWRVIIGTCAYRDWLKKEAMKNAKG